VCVCAYLWLYRGKRPVRTKLDSVSRHPLLLSAREPRIIGLICGKIGGSFAERDLYAPNLTPCLVTPLFFAVSFHKRATNHRAHQYWRLFCKKLTPTLSKESSPLQVSFHKRTTNFMSHSWNYCRLICGNTMNLLQPAPLDSIFAGAGWKWISLDTRGSKEKGCDETLSRVTRHGAIFGQISRECCRVFFQVIIGGSFGGKRQNPLALTQLDSISRHSPSLCCLCPQKSQYFQLRKHDLLPLDSGLFPQKGR